MKLLTLVLLLSVFSSLSLMEVVKNFEKSKCSEFFIRSPNKRSIITPTVFKGYQYKQICQFWSKKYRFATLYDTERRIPVYSAYTFTGQKNIIRNNEWKNEPQLENVRHSPDMELIPKDKMDEFFHQAVSRDYEQSKKNTNSEYTRGHVFPLQYAGNQEQGDSTFTFTNIAPQTQHSNKKWDENVETPMMREIIKKCKPTFTNPTYIVTGVVPGNKWIPITRKEGNKAKIFDQGINIPSFFWTAFSCPDTKTKHIFQAYLVRQNEANEKTYEFNNMSVNMLNAHLTRLYKQDFSVFGGLYSTNSTSFHPSSIPLTPELEI